MDEVAEHRVVHVVTDNGPNYKGARKLLMQRRQFLLDAMCNVLHRYDVEGHCRE